LFTNEVLLESAFEMHTHQNHVFGHNDDAFCRVNISRLISPRDGVDSQNAPGWRAFSGMSVWNIFDIMFYSYMI